MAGISKSRYTKGVQCPKMLWMQAHMPQEYDETVMNQQVLVNGNILGDLAMGYYGPFVEVPYDADDYAGMAAFTQAELRKGTPVICEATFAYDGCLCMVDILRMEPDGVHLVEVKSSTHCKDIYLHDMAFQTWLLGRCGLKVLSVSLMHVNGAYVRHGELDLAGLFTVEDKTTEVMAMQDGVAANVEAFKRAIVGEDEPACERGKRCRDPYPCGFQGWCFRDLPKPSVVNLNRVNFSSALKLIDQGIVTMADFLEAPGKKTRRQLVQAQAEAQGREIIVERAELGKFLGKLTFPLYFLDFETWQPAVPPFDGTSPYQQLPTQFSLHVLREAGGQAEHHEFLAKEGTDPREAVAAELVRLIPRGVTTLAYNMSFEKGRIKELASYVPELADHLLAIEGGMVDLITPFNNGCVYAHAMGGSNSIKAVLPAFFPDDPSLDYHALEGVHNGVEAMDAFCAMAHMSPEEIATTREQLLRYCELDTLAMVKLYQKLVELAR